MEEYSNDEEKVKFLKERYDRLELLEEQNLTTTSRYYFVLVSDNDKALEHISEEMKMHCYNMTPRLNVKTITNKTSIISMKGTILMLSIRLEYLITKP